MNALVLLMGVAAGTALLFAGLTAEGDRRADEGRGFIHYFMAGPFVI